jgi:hypothetical protein
MIVWRDTYCSADTSYVYTHEGAHKSVVWVTSYRSCVEFYALTYHRVANNQAILPRIGWLFAKTTKQTKPRLHNRPNNLGLLVCLFG